MSYKTLLYSRISIQYSSSEEPIYGSWTSPVETAATEPSKQVSPAISRARHTDNSSPHHRVSPRGKETNAQSGPLCTDAVRFSVVCRIVSRC